MDTKAQRDHVQVREGGSHRSFYTKDEISEFEYINLDMSRKARCGGGGEG